MDYILKYVLNQNTKKYICNIFLINIDYILEDLLNCHQFRNITFHSVAFLRSFCIKSKYRIKKNKKRFWGKNKMGS